MQKIMYVENGGLSVVNEELNDGWKIVSIHVINNNVAAAGESDYIVHEGNVFAYIILEK